MSKKSQKTTDSSSFYYQRSTDRKLPYTQRIYNIDASIRITALTEIDSLYLQRIAYKSTIYGQMKAYDKAIGCAGELLAEADGRGNVHYTARAYEKLSLYHKNLQQYDKAFRYGNEALILFKDLEDYGKVLKISKRLANIQFNLGDLAGAEITAVNALEIGVLRNDPAQLAWHYDLLAKVYQSRALFDEAIRYHKESISKEDSPKSKAALLGNYAVTLTKKGDFEGAIALFQKALGQGYLTGLARNRIMGNLAYVKSKRNLPEAESLMLKARALKEEVGDIEGLFASAIQLSKFYEDTGKKSSSIAWANQAETIARDIKNPEALIESYELLIDRKVLTTQKMIHYKKLKDSLFGVQRSYAFQFAKVKYDFDTAEKEKSAALYIAQQSEYKRNIAYLVVFGVIAFSVLFYLLERQRSKKQELEARLSTEAKISKKVHDTLANDVFGLRSELEQQAVSSHTLNKVDTLYQRTRDISREYSPVDTEVNFPNTISFMLRSILPQDAKLILKGLDAMDWSKIRQEKKLALYRSLQELMVNVNKHSNGSVVVIAFAKAKKNITIHFSDNGKTNKIQKSLGNGLQNVETRISDLNGTFTFELDNEVGCKATIRIPA